MQIWESKHYDTFNTNEEKLLVKFRYSEKATEFEKKCPSIFDITKGQ